ncbi:MAG: hypothetical protein ACRC6D_15460 [Aeromonas sp.]
MAFTDEINNLGFTVKHDHDVFFGLTGKRDSLVLVGRLFREGVLRGVAACQATA